VPTDVNREIMFLPLTRKCLCARDQVIKKTIPVFIRCCGLI
jgi:hypothetical protein